MSRPLRPRQDTRGPDRPLASLIRRTVIACAARPARVIAVAALLCAGALFHVVTHFAIDTDTSKLIADNVPWRQRELAFAAAFPQRVDLIAIVVDGATPELAEHATTTLATRLARAGEPFRAVWRPDGGTFFDREGLLFASTDEVAQTMQRLIAAQPLLGTLAADPSLRGLMDALSLVAAGVQQDPAALDALGKPLGALAAAFESIVAGETPAFSWQTLFTGQAPDPRSLRRFILVQPVLDYSALAPGEAASTAIRRAVHEQHLDADPRVHVRLTGPVPLADDEFATLAEGAALNTAVTLLVVILLLWIALRSWRLIAAILASLAVGLIVTAAVGLLAFGAFNLISVAFAILFVGLGVDFGIQFCMAYRARRHATGDLQHALRDIGGEVGPALALAAAATAAGFYAFVPTDYRGVSELGVIAGTGMLIAFIASITLLPALIVWLRPGGEPANVGYAALAPLDRLLVVRRRIVLAAAALVAAAGLALVPRVAFDFNPLHLRSPEAESVATLLDLMKDSATAPDTIDVLAPSVDAATKLGDRLAQLPEVDHVLSIATFVPEGQQEKLASIEDAALLLDPTLNPAATKPAPSDAETAAAMTRAERGLHEARAMHPGVAFAAPAARLAHALRQLADGTSGQRDHARAVLIPGLVAALGQLRAVMQAEPVTLATLPDTLKRDWVTPDGRARVEVYPKGEVGDDEALGRFVDAVEALAPDATGAPVSIAASSRTIIEAFLQAGVWALLSITVLLAMTLRRASDVARTLLPLVLSALGTLGTCVLIGLPLNFENIIALPLLFGIGVAFNIYFVMAWRAGRGQPLQSSLTRAVIMSGLTTGTAFGTLWLSHHPGTSSMGELLALSLAWTLVSALLFLPALLGAPRQVNAIEGSKGDGSASQ
jgi:hopanoid biosynthesis associated RND transporter like protein HpnN